MDSREVFLGIVGEVDRGPGLGARLQAVHAGVPEFHAIVLVLRPHHVPFSVIPQLARVAVWLLHAKRLAEKIEVASFEVARRILHAHAAAQPIIGPASLCPIRRAQGCQVSGAVVPQQRLRSRGIGHSYKAGAGPAKQRLLSQGIGTLDHLAVVAVEPFPFAARRT